MVHRPLCIFGAFVLAILFFGCKPADLAATQTSIAKTATGATVPMTKTQTPSVPATPSDTVVPTDAPTATETKVSVLFGQAVFSSDILYQGAESCSPQTLKVEMQVTPPEMVSSVGLFYRIVAKSGQHSVPWGGGLSMIPEGAGWYKLTLVGDELPDVDDWWEDAWLDFQFVANDENQHPVAKSDVVRSVTLSQCYV